MKDSHTGFQRLTSICAGLALASWLGVASAQEAKPAAQSVGAKKKIAPVALTPEGREDRGHKRILYLKTGQVLRKRARQVDGQWEVRDGRHWTPLAPGLVERASFERDVLAQARKLERSLERDDNVRRVAYTEWLTQQGLYEEAIRSLDRVFRSDPDQAQALELIARTDLPIALPSLGSSSRELNATLSAFFNAASRTTPTAREVAIQRLARTEGLPDLLPILRQEMLTKSPKRRAFATHAVRRLFPERAVRSLLSRAILDPNQDVRQGASLALRDVENPAVILPVVKALGSKNSKVSANAVAALGNMGYPAAAEPLMHHLTSTLQSASGRPPHAHVYVGRQMAYIQDFDVEVAQGSAIADPIVNVLHEGTILDAGVLGVTDYTVMTQRAATRRALGQVTGANPGNTTKQWARWWEESGDEWKAANLEPGPPSSPKSPGS